MAEKTAVVRVDPERPDPDAIERAAEIIRAGGLVAFPTETVYGLGADATDERAVRRIFEAKGRPSTNPLIVHADSLETARAFASAWPKHADTLAEAFWPGPLSLIVPKAPSIPDAVSAGRDTVGIRVPRSATALELIRRSGRPIAAPSANRSTGVSPTTAEHVAKDLLGRIDMILDAGPCEVGLESAVLDLSTVRPRLLRPGAITPERIAEILGVDVEVATRFEPTFPGQGSKSPGTAEIHYAPRTRSYRLELDRWSEAARSGKTGSVLIGQAVRPPESETVVLLETPEEASRRLYETLHRLDALGLDRILIVPPPNTPAWRAIRDRLRRATADYPSETGERG